MSADESALTASTQPFSPLQILLTHSLLATRNVTSAWLIDRQSAALLAGVSVIGGGGPGDAGTDDAKMPPAISLGLPTEQITTLLRELLDPAQLRRTQPFTWQGRNYACVRADTHSVYGRLLRPQQSAGRPQPRDVTKDHVGVDANAEIGQETKTQCSDSGSGGLIVTMTPRVVLAAVYPPHAYAAVAVEAVERLTDYLKTKE